MTCLRCGRIDDHPAHDWRTPDQLESPWYGPVRRCERVTFHCSGHVVIEGGHRELMR